MKTASFCCQVRYDLLVKRISGWEEGEGVFARILITSISQVDVVGWGRVVPAVPCNLASICLERKVVIVIVSVLDLCTECVIFFKRFILILFTNFN